MFRPSRAASTGGGAERRQQRHQQQGGRQVGEQVGQHGREQRDAAAARRTTCRPAAGPAHQVAEEPVAERGHHDAEAEHEDGERGVRGARRLRASSSPPARRPGDQHQRRAPDDPERARRPAASSTAKPTSISADRHHREAGHRRAARGHVGRVRLRRRRSPRRAAAARRTRRRARPASTGAITAAKPQEGRGRGTARQQVGEVGDRQQQRGGVRQPQAGVGRRAARTRPAAAAAATTTGVSSTTVASRLSTAVTSAASRKTPVNSGTGPAAARPAHHTARPRRTRPPGAHTSATTRMVTRNSDHRTEVAQLVAERSAREDAGRQGRRGRRQPDARLECGRAGARYAVTSRTRSAATGTRSTASGTEST